MTSGALSLAVVGWIAAGGSGAALVAGRRRYERLERRVAEAAHELRGPLCTARLALDGLARPGADSARRAAAAIDLELRRAGLALEDLTSAAVTRSPARRPGPAPECDAGAVLAAAEPGWHALAAAHGASLRVQRPLAPARARVDGVRLGQAVGNLVANAAEHGGGSVRVLLRAGAQRVRVEVADDGPGLPAPVAALAKRARRGPRGHGLAIAAGIAERCGGRLAAAPSARGARLVLELPAAAAVRRSLASEAPR